MKIKLKPDKDVRVENIKAVGVEVEVDVYHTDMHAFDMLRDDDLSQEAIEKFERQFENALEDINLK